MMGLNDPHLQAPGQVRVRIENLLALIGKRNPAWHVFTSVMETEALADADASDARHQQRAAIGPLDGLSVAIKDNIDVRGQVTSAGIGHYRHATAAVDSPFVKSLRAAGLVIVGKTNMHEAALGITSDNPWYGRCENPRHPGYSPGGSSGGSAAAVAGGLCSLAAGTDSMGSIRIPAACCGIAGFIPTRGRIDISGITPLSPRLDMPGLIAQSAADLGSAWQALSGEQLAEPPAPGHWRVGMMSKLPGIALDAAMEQMMVHVAARLARAGANPVLLAPKNLDFARLRAECFVLCEIDAAKVHAAALAADPQGFSAELRRMLEYGARQSPERRLDILKRLDAARDTLLAQFHAFDFLILPTMPQPAFLHGTAPPPHMADLTVAANIAGVPVVTIPWGTALNGLPLSLQILAAPGYEIPLLAAATLMEQWQPG